MKKILLFITVAVIFTSCGKDINNDGRGSQGINDGQDQQPSTSAISGLSAIDGAVPVVTMAGSRADKMYKLNPRTALLSATESRDGYADLKLDYEWVDGRNSVAMSIEIKDVPYVVNDKGIAISVEDGIPGTVVYSEKWQYPVETVFTIDAAKEGGLETAYLKLASEEIVLEVSSFSDKQLEGNGAWAIIDWYLVGKEIFVNALDGDLTITLPQEEMRPSFKGMTFTLKPGDSREVEVDDVGYSGTHEVIVEYGNEKLVLTHQEDAPLSLETRSTKTSSYGLIRYFDGGFLHLLRYPIDTYTFSAETLLQ